mmetsp:Transcript_7454/g.19261  ORF Transcript_7454/g.19261 Transcript_7454/m.19261 type:complete len:278 (-) Transcript_7454:388-1221(-)
MGGRRDAVTLTTPNKDRASPLTRCRERGGRWGVGAGARLDVHEDRLQEVRRVGLGVGAHVAAGLDEEPHGGVEHKDVRKRAQQLPPVLALLPLEHGQDGGAHGRVGAPEGVAVLHRAGVVRPEVDNFRHHVHLGRLHAAGNEGLAMEAAGHPHLVVVRVALRCSTGPNAVLLPHGACNHEGPLARRRPPALPLPAHCPPAGRLVVRVRQGLAAREARVLIGDAADPLEGHMHHRHVRHAQPLPVPARLQRLQRLRVPLWLSRASRVVLVAAIDAQVA